MEIFIATASIVALTVFMLTFNRIRPFRFRLRRSFKICPICAGVSGTWLWILLGIYAGWLEAESWKFIVAIAMGGSVVGIAYQVEKRLTASVGWRTPLLWKAIFIPLGFVAVYSLISLRWSLSAGVILVLLALALAFLRPQAPRASEQEESRDIEALEEKMKSCC